MSGQRIELSPDGGLPEGITTARVVGWTGHVLLGPRSSPAEILKRSEAQVSGAHMLLGADRSAVGETRCCMDTYADWENRGL